MKTPFPLALLAAAVLVSAGTANAQVAGATTFAVAATDVDQVARGWSARRSILNRSIFTESGAKIGKVDDLIVDPDKNVSYLIIGAGGFVGMGQHAVAVPTSQFHEVGERLVWTGATRDAVAALPPFRYTPFARTHSPVVAKAEHEIGLARSRVALLEKKSDAVASDAKSRIDRQIVDLKDSQKTVEDKLVAMKAASATEWKAVEGEVDRATLRLRDAIEKAVG